MSVEVCGRALKNLQISGVENHQLTGNSSVRSWAIHSKLHATVRTQSASGNCRLRSTFIPDTECICRNSEWCCTGLGFVLVWIPDNLSCGTRYCVLRAIRGTNRVGVAIVGA
jgi:hypothetical protein